MVVTRDPGPELQTGETGAAYAQNPRTFSQPTRGRGAHETLLWAQDNHPKFMKALSRLPQSQPATRRRLERARYDASSLAYEDVVSLATRLTKKGYSEIGADFLAFANDPKGLAALYVVAAKNRKRIPLPTISAELAAAMPYLAAANLLLKSKALRRDEVAQAVLLIALTKADVRAAEEDEPPIFMD